MKKNRLMRIAALLLVLTLATSCFVGGTFAKYTSTTGAVDSARVAHWGFETGNAATVMVNLFTPDSETGIDQTNGGEYAVIAPGSSNEETFAFINADGATNPEVAYKVTFRIDPTTTAALDAELEEALSFTLQVGGGAVTNCDTWADLLTAIKGLSGDSTDGIKEYAAGADVPDALKNGTNITVGWAWAFERGDDAGDTSLGNKALADLARLTLGVSVIVEQLDTAP